MLGRLFCGLRHGCRTATLVAMALFACCAASLSLAAGESPAPAGQVTLSIGTSHIVRAGRSVDIAKGGSVLAGDVVRTAANGHVHIRFIDGARVSVRPDTILHVVEYRYDPANPAASVVKFQLETGTVREISGLAAESARDRFRLNTPLVAIGVKGTDFTTQASAGSTVVLVQQGGIALTPFDAVCQASGLGACSTARTRELSASMRGMALVYRRAAQEPVLQPVNSLKGADKITPILMQEHLGANGRSAAAVVADAKSPGTVTDVLASQQSLVWGRWGGQARPGDSLTIPFADAMRGNQVMVGDGYYFLFRGSNVPDLLASHSASGVVNFGLQGGTAAYRAPSNDLSAASVSGGSLAIDFAHNTYATSLSVSAPAVGAQSMNSSGGIDPKTGIFLSTAGSRTAGAVSLDLRQAGYFFSKPVGNGALVGATTWGR